MDLDLDLVFGFGIWIWYLDLVFGFGFEWEYGFQFVESVLRGNRWQRVILYSSSHLSTLATSYSVL